MKIREIIVEHEFPKAKERHMHQAPDIYDYDDEEAYWDDDADEGPPEKQFRQHPDVEKLGMGAFATAYRSKKNPYDVVKGSRAMRDKDGFAAFYDMIAANEDAQSNPYFPRFRDMSKYTDDDDKQSYIARMEPLEKFQSLSTKELKTLSHRLFSDHGRDVIRHYYAEEHPHEGYLDDEELYTTPMVGWAIKRAVENDMWGDELRWEIEDDQFKEAVDIIRNSPEKEEFDPDLHYNNLMIRRTSVGPQLVLNDPFGGSSEKWAEWEEEGEW